MTDRNTVSKNASPVCRRRFLRVGIGAVAAAAALDPVDVLAYYGGSAASAMAPVRQVSLVNINTSERLTVDYWANGRYVTDALRAVSHLMRDHHDGSIHAIDPRLVDLMFGVFRLAGGCGPIQVVCGYRSARTNARMRAHHHGVAGHSLHVLGKAVDIRMPDCGLPALHRAALALRAGGVGFYPRSNFVHIDTGPVRTWGSHGSEDEVGEAPAWRDALLSDTPRVQHATDAGLLPAESHSSHLVDAVAPRGRLASILERPPGVPGHKPMRVATRDLAPVQSEGFWLRRKPRLSVGG
ncbi:MAG: DUF882 domain-containing protein [Rhodospirillaceae bacterium]